MSCFRNIDDALKEFDSSIVTKPDVKNKIVTVETIHTVEQVTKLIEDAGYPVSEVI